MYQYKGQVVCYARVGAADQNQARQLEAVGDVDRLLSEKVSGKNIDGRAKLKGVLAYVCEDDQVRAKSPDRLARPTSDLVPQVEQLKSKSVALEFFNNPALNTDTPQEEFMLTVPAAISQLDRTTVLERRAEVIARCKRTYDRAPKPGLEQIEQARRRSAANVPKAEVAASYLAVSRLRLYAALSRWEVF